MTNYKLLRRIIRLIVRAIISNWTFYFVTLILERVTSLTRIALPRETDRSPTVWINESMSSPRPSTKSTKSRGAELLIERGAARDDKDCCFRSPNRRRTFLWRRRRSHHEGERMHCLRLIVRPGSAQRRTKSRCDEVTANVAGYDSRVV